MSTDKTTSEVQPLYSNYQLKAIKGGAFWSKFSAIIMFISAGLTILGGLPMLLFFGLGLIYMGIGVLYIFMGIWQWKAGDALTEASNTDDIVTAKDKLIVMVANYRTMYKVSFIVFGSMIVLGILLAILLLVFGLASNNWY